MCNHLTNHHVIINWNEKAEAIVKSLRDKEIENQRPIIVLTENKTEMAFLAHQYHECYHLTGDVLDECTLNKANIVHAESIIILQDQNLKGEVADARNILITLTIARLCNKLGNTPKPVVIEMEDPQKAVLSDIAPSAKALRIEVVSSRGIIGNLIVQAALNPGLTGIYNELLTFKEESSEVYRWEVKEKGSVEGMKWSDLRRRCLELSTKKAILPLALEREGNVLLNPSDQAVEVIKKNDHLFIVCDHVSELKQLR